MIARLDGCLKLKKKGKKKNNVKALPTYPHLSGVYLLFIQLLSRPIFITPDVILCLRRIFQGLIFTVQLHSPETKSPNSTLQTLFSNHCNWVYPVGTAQGEG